MHFASTLAVLPNLIVRSYLSDSAHDVPGVCCGHGLEGNGVLAADQNLANRDGPRGPPDSLVDLLAVLWVCRLLLVGHH